MTKKEKKELEVSEKKCVEQSEGEPIQEGVFYVPEVDIIENENSITLLADIPGVDKKNVQIDVKESVLTLTATVEPPLPHQQLTYKEYDLGGYMRRFSLGERIDQDKINASIENGVLTLVLPKAEAHKPRKIAVS